VNRALSSEEETCHEEDCVFGHSQVRDLSRASVAQIPGLAKAEHPGALSLDSHPVAAPMEVLADQMLECMARMVFGRRILAASDLVVESESRGHCCMDETCTQCDPIGNGFVQGDVVKTVKDETTTEEFSLIWS